ncbi:CapA family protein [Clostridium tertium]|uniref:CapA family protein n=1 Tax=Clostridium tertium TaxID=1559 RepID=UPI00241C6D11|nr:CapA family protein [Clostridium tertium]
MKGNGKRIILLIAMFIIVAVGVFFIPRVEIILNNFNNKAMENTDNISSDEYQDEDIEVEGNDIKTIDIVATGDFLIHKEILETQYNEQSDTYDFKNTIQYVKDYLNNADLTIVNMEGTLSGLDNYGYSGYPSFNAPDELADAMKWVGVDVVNNMNNHSLDRDVRGFNRTRSVLKERSFDIIGTRESTNDNRYVIKDVNGIKVGIISYSYSMTAEGGARGLNGTTIPEELYPLMNTFREDTLDLDFQEMKEQILDMRNNAAEVIIFYMHWGDEYELEPNSTQIKIAEFLANQNVDIIFGTHPHSLQPIDIIKSEDGTNETAVIYSMGNFLSSQRTERIQNPYTEDGVIVSVRLSKNTKTNEIKIEYPTYIPTWVNWYEKDGRLFYEVVPSTINDADYLKEEGKGRVIESLNRTRGIIEKYNDKIKIRE